MLLTAKEKSVKRDTSKEGALLTEGSAFVQMRALSQQARQKEVRFMNTEKFARWLASFAQTVAGKLERQLDRTRRMRREGMLADMPSGTDAEHELRQSLESVVAPQIGHDPAILEPGDAVVFLWRAFIREMMGVGHRRDPDLKLHRVFFPGLSKSLELNADEKLPSLLVVVMDFPERIGASMEYGAFQMGVCSMTLTLVRTCSLEPIIPGGESVPQYRLADVLASVIMDFRSATRLSDAVVGNDTVIGWQTLQSAGDIAYQRRFNDLEPKSQRIRREPIPCLNLVTGPHTLDPNWCRAITRSRQRTVLGRFSIVDRVSMIEIASSLALREVEGWLFQPGVLTPWTWGALLTQGMADKGLVLRTNLRRDLRMDAYAVDADLYVSNRESRWGTPATGEAWHNSGFLISVPDMNSEDVLLDLMME